jgi:small subunit ribosomal protein S16
MLRIRLRRVGKRGKPSYRIVVAEARSPRDGAYLEWIGNYDPMSDPPSVTLKADRATEWLGKGAQPSDAVKRILHWDGILEREPMQRTPKRKKEEKPVTSAAAAPTATLTAVAPAAVAQAEDAPADAPLEETVDEQPAEDTPAENPPEEEAAEEQTVEEDPSGDEAEPEAEPEAE